MPELSITNESKTLGRVDCIQVWAKHELSTTMQAKHLAKNVMAKLSAFKFELSMS